MNATESDSFNQKKDFSFQFLRFRKFTDLTVYSDQGGNSLDISLLLMKICVIPFNINWQLFLIILWQIYGVIYIHLKLKITFNLFSR